MGLIKRRPKDTMKPITFPLPESLIQKLDSYAESVNVPQAEIVAVAIKYAIESDKEFSTECTQSAISGTIETQQIVIPGAPETHQKRTNSGVAVPPSESTPPHKTDAVKKAVAL